MSLGVGTSPTTSKHPLTEVADAVDLCTPTRDLKNVPRHSVQLQYNRHDERKHMERRQKLLAAGNANPNSSSSSSSSPSAFEKSKPKRSITFNESVDVVPIPMRHEYSDRIRSRLWSNTIELYENAARNHVEYASEGYDWRNAADDEQMYICRTTGEKIHPIHYEMMPQLSHTLLESNHGASPFLSHSSKKNYWQEAV